MEGNTRANTYLRSFNVFVSRVRNSDLIEIVVPKFVQRILLTDKTAISNIQHFKKSIQSRSELIEDAVCYLLCMWHSVNVFDVKKPLFPHLIPLELTSSVMLKELCSWKTRGPSIKKSGRLTRSEVDCIVTKRDIGNNTKQLKLEDFKYFCRKLSIGDIVITGKKSLAADIIVKAGKNLVIEVQCKSGKQKLSLTNVKEEVDKSVVTYSKKLKSIFVIVVPSGITYVHSSESISKPNVTVLIPSKYDLEQFFGQKETLECFQMNDLL